MIPFEADPLVDLIREEMSRRKLEDVYQDLLKNSELFPTWNTDMTQLLTIDSSLTEEEVDNGGWIVIMMSQIVKECMELIWNFVHEQLGYIVVEEDSFNLTDLEKKVVMNVVSMWAALNFAPVSPGNTETMVEDETLLSNLTWSRGLIERLMILNTLQTRALVNSITKNPRPLQVTDYPPFLFGDDEEEEED